MNPKNKKQTKKMPILGFFLFVFLCFSAVLVVFLVLPLVFLSFKEKRDGWEKKKRKKEGGLGTKNKFGVGDRPPYEGKILKKK